MSLILIALTVWFDPSPGSDIVRAFLFLRLTLLGVLNLFAKSDGEVEQATTRGLYKVIRGPISGRKNVSGKTAESGGNDSKDQSNTH